MTKITYTSLKLKANTDVKIVESGENKIEVLQYLPINDKIDLIDITLQKSVDGSVYNPIKLDMYFHLNLIYLYTNISFTEKQREDEYKLYDVLTSSGLMDKILEAIPFEEYENLLDYIETSVNDSVNYKNTLLGVIQGIISTLKIDPEKINKALEGIDMEKFTEAMNFAEAVGYKPENN